MRGIALWTKLLDLRMCILCSQSITVCIYPVVHPMLPLPNPFHQYRSKSFQHVFLQSVKSIIIVISKILLDTTPEVFNEIEFATESPVSVTNTILIIMIVFIWFLLIGWLLRFKQMSRSIAIRLILCSFLCLTCTGLLHFGLNGNFGMSSKHLCWESQKKQILQFYNSKCRCWHPYEIYFFWSWPILCLSKSNAD